jgi:hypothetical protein
MSDKTSLCKPLKRTKQAKIVIVTIILTVVVIAYIIYKKYYDIVDKTISNLVEDLRKSCLSWGTPSYRLTLERPLVNGVYEKNVATALWDIGTAVSLSNCREGIPTPPPFTHTHIVRASDGIMYAYIFSNEEMACIAFTGTFDRAQWYDNMKLKLVHPENLSSNKSLMIHTGYHDIYSSIQNELHEWWSANSSGKSTLFITGHSLGGALSTLCAFDFSSLVPSDMIVHYAMSSPRVGNVAFSEIFDQRSPNSFRVYNTEDIVVNLPLASWKGNVYQHICAKRGGVPFTRSMETLSENHIDAYNELPD